MNLIEAERLLGASPDHRILRRIPPVEQWRFAKREAEVRRAVFVDVETTGLEETDEVIELALLPFEYNRSSGEIVSVDEVGAFCSYRQPSFPIPAASAQIHGITDADVAGHAIDEAAVRAIIGDAHLLIAHNASFDRPMVEKHWPVFAEKHWACSLREIDWRAEGLSSGKLDYLLLKLGWFFDGHRALSDAAAGAFLLAQRLPVSKRSTLAALLECARRPLKAVRAEETAFAQRAALKQRGYRWDAGAPDRPKAWWILTESPEEEVSWLNANVYAKPRDIPVQRVPATLRYSARIWA